MSKRVYISADYDSNNGDQEVVQELTKWGRDNLHIVDFIDMAEVRSGTVANNPDCRICELKAEFNRQIKASSAAIFVVGDKTSTRTAGEGCERMRKNWSECYCTPYKQNANGLKLCKFFITSTPSANECGNINSFSYLRHEFEQAKISSTPIIIVYNSTRNETNWLPSYMNGYENKARPFWKYENGKKVGDYLYIKEALGF